MLLLGGITAARWNISFQPAVSVLDVSIGENLEGNLYISR